MNSLPNSAANGAIIAVPERCSRSWSLASVLSARAVYREPILLVRHVITGGANQTTARVIQLMKVRLAGVGEGLAAEASPSQATTSNG